MFTKAIRCARSISESAKEFSFASQKSTIFNGLALMVTCGMGAALPTPAQAASFTGFGCIDDAACQSYLYSYAIIAGDSPYFDPGFEYHTPDNVMMSPMSPSAYSGAEMEGAFSKIGSNGTASGYASINAVAELGILKGKAVALTTAGDLQEDDFSGVVARSGAQVYLGWGDTITVTSNSYLPGEWVPFEIRLHLDRSLSTSGRNGGNSQVYIGSDLSTGGAYAYIAETNYYPSNIKEVTEIAYLPVGELSAIQGRLWLGAGSQVGAQLPYQSYQTDLSIVDASHTAKYYLTPLVDGVSYTSGSGKTYFYSPPAKKVPEPTSPLSLVALVGFGFLGKRRSCTKKEPVITNQAG